MGKIYWRERDEEVSRNETTKNRPFWRCEVGEGFLSLFLAVDVEICLVSSSSRAGGGCLGQQASDPGDLVVSAVLRSTYGNPCCIVRYPGVVQVGACSSELALAGTV